MDYAQKMNQNMKPTILENLRLQLTLQQHRALVILSGSRSWQSQCLTNLWQPSESILWLGQPEPYLVNSNNSAKIESILPSQLSYILGQETDSVVIDSAEGLNANALGISAGMIRAGGLLIILTPEIEEWRRSTNPDNQRFLNSPYQLDQALPYFTEHLIQQWQSGTVWLHESPAAPSTNKTFLEDIKNSAPKARASSLPTTDQQAAIKAIHSVAFGHRKRPLVVSADRGRGKSSSLGLAAIDCLMDGKQHIVLTASRLDQAKMAFHHALLAIELLAESNPIELIQQQTGKLSFKLGQQLKTFEFIAPDQLILEPSKADLLFVDEAAHLPTPLLTQLLHRHHRMVFATTLHGYEGSGRGFELRFKKTLNQFTPDWKNIHLQQPIRWADNDPLEACINKALFLNPITQVNAAPKKDQPAFDMQDLTLTQVNIETLMKTPKQLHALFELLVQAHYQTSPNDLQQLLCAPNLKIMTAQDKEQIIGVILCVEEGKVMPNMTRAHGHLVPQLLVKQYASTDFLMLSSWRIMRIAVDPQRQCQGIGKALLNHLEVVAKQEQIDYLSSSFGASDELLPFWFGQHYKPLHIGVKRDKSSGSHNLVVALALTPMAQQAIACIQRSFQAQFPHILIESLNHLSASICISILKSFRFMNQDASLEEAVHQYRDQKRVYESISGLLWKWSIRNPMILCPAQLKQQEVWCDKVLKKMSWQEVANRHHLAGRKGVETEMRSMLNKLVINHSKQPNKPVIKSNFGRPV